MNTNGFIFTFLLTFIISGYSFSNEKICTPISKIIINSFGGYEALESYSENLASGLDGRYEVKLNNGQGYLSNLLNSKFYDQTTEVTISVTSYRGHCASQVADIKHLISEMPLREDLKHKFIYDTKSSVSKFYENVVYIYFDQGFAVKRKFN